MNFSQSRPGHVPVLIVGGGLAGLIASIRLVQWGIECVLIEKKSYPFHRVCGEYVSNETTPFLKKENLYPESFNPPQLNQFQLTSVSGKSKKINLDLGGFGISRFSYDHFLYQMAIQEGVKVITNHEVEQAEFNEEEDIFNVTSTDQRFTSTLVIGSFGKRSKLDKSLNRNFMDKRSPYVGVKYHIHTQHPDNLIALHNFNGGYCGVSNIEFGKTNLCYLVHRNQVKRFINIAELEETILHQNPWLKSLFTNSKFLFDKPEVINEISFETKEPVWKHILMAGDAAGMIAPLCGNGMAMAIHSAKILSDSILQCKQENQSRFWLENTYRNKWNSMFAQRLRAGRLIQNNLFGSEWSSRIAIQLAINSESLTQLIIRKTHGEAF